MLQTQHSDINTYQPWRGEAKRSYWISVKTVFGSQKRPCWCFTSCTRVVQMCDGKEQNKDIVMSVYVHKAAEHQLGQPQAVSQWPLRLSARPELTQAPTCNMLAWRRTACVRTLKLAYRICQHQASVCLSTQLGSELSCAAVSEKLGDAESEAQLLFIALN